MATSINLPPSQVSGEMTPAPVTPSNPTPSAATPKVENIPGHADLIKRQEELERKEAELDRRERQMNVSILDVGNKKTYHGMNL